MRQLAPQRLKTRQQLELALVVEAVVGPAERHHAVRLVAATERARHQVGRVDRAPAADKTTQAGDLEPLGD